MLALTLLAYSTENAKTTFVEEPENGIHPQAMETIFQSLSSVYEGQVLVATHSPVLVGLIEPRQLLCFSKTSLAELCANGWTRDRVEIIVVDPEIEAWLRFDSTHLTDLVQKRARRNREQAELLFSTVRSRAIVETGGVVSTGKPNNRKTLMVRPDRRNR